MNSYTVFELKPDAIVRGIRDSIRTDIIAYYDIVIEKEVIIDRDTILRLREREWRTKWPQYPDEQQREFCITGEEGDAVVMLCKVRTDGDAIRLGRKLRGENPIPQLCDRDSIRGKYSDSTVRLEIEEGIGFICDSVGRRIGFVPNIIHTVDDVREMQEHVQVYFPDIELERLK